MAEDKDSRTAIVVAIGVLGALGAAIIGKAAASLRSAPSGVRSGTHSWLNVSTGKHCFKTEVLHSRGHHGVNASHGADMRMVLWS